MARILRLTASLLAFAIVVSANYGAPQPLISGDALYFSNGNNGHMYLPQTPAYKPGVYGNVNGYVPPSYGPAPNYPSNSYPAPPPYSFPPPPPQNRYQVSPIRPSYGVTGPSYAPQSSYGFPYYPKKSYRKPSYEVAEAILRGYSDTLNENNNKAFIKLYQDKNLGLSLNMRLCNLTANTYYSFYVHQFGELNNGCESTGPQYTTRPITTHPLTGLQTHPTGFLGFIKTNNESQIFQTNTKELYLEDIIGRSIVLHELAVNASALPSPLNESVINNLSLFLNPGPNSFIIGRRLACGIIGRANPVTFNRPIEPNCEIVLTPPPQNIVNLSSVFGNQAGLVLRNINKFNSGNPNLIVQPQSNAKSYS